MPDGEWKFNRFHACWQAGLTYTAYDIKTHAPVGSAHFTLTQDFTLSNNKTDWVENVSLRMDSRAGIVTSMTATWTAGCNSRCTVTQSQPFAPLTPITEGAVLAGTMAFADPQQAGQVDNFAPGYTLELYSPGSLGDPPVQWETPPLRCDAQDGGISPGCVISPFWPTFEVKSAARPAAAVGMRWAQDNLPAHPGLFGSGEALHRLTDKAKIRSNRTAICRNGWKPSPDVPVDSCDEFPFASTYEGGSMPGPECAEILPRVDAEGQPILGQDGQPIIDVIHAPAPETTCLRAHIPRKQNTSIGSDLAAFYRGQRIIDNDPFWVAAA